MNRSLAEPSPGDGDDESRWACLFRHWALHYLLPGLLAFAVMGYGLLRESQEREQRQQKQVERVWEQMTQDVREGKATDAELILLGIDPKKYRERIASSHHESGVETSAPQTEKPPAPAR